MKFRFSTFMAGLLSLSISIAYLILGINSIIKLSTGFIPDNDGLTALFIIFGVWIFWGIALLIVGSFFLFIVIFSFIQAVTKLSLAFKNDEDYHLSSTTLNINLVLDIVLAILNFILLIASSGFVLFGICGGLHTLSLIFLLITRSKFKHDLKSGKVKIEKKEIAINPMYLMEKELKRLEEKKNNGVIRDDEYEQLRKSIIDKYAEQVGGTPTKKEEVIEVTKNKEDDE